VSAVLRKPCFTSDDELDRGVGTADLQDAVGINTRDK
jgi:hypothetical protein